MIEERIKIPNENFMLTVEQASELVTVKVPFTWEWLAGFFQAEGCVSANYNTCQPEMIISQSEPQILDDIEKFLRLE